VGSLGSQRTRPNEGARHAEALQLPPARASSGIPPYPEACHEPKAVIESPDNHLHAQIEVHGDGWDISAEVDLLDCGVAECKCPCE
jgi:hypothetical protein